MFTMKKIPIPIHGLCTRELGESIIIITEDGGELHSLDEVGSFIWKTINGEISAQGIVEKLCAEYEVEKKQAAEDVKKFIAELKTKNLITLK